MASPSPAWLKQLLIDKGVLTESGLSRRARLMRHRPCGLPTLHGLDGDICALTACVDLGELHATGEALALLDGRRTYELGISQHLFYRDRYAIKARPAGQRTTVLTEHRCHDFLPAAWCVPTPPTAARRTDTEEIGF